MPISPTAEGFRAAFRRPLLSVTEVAWRWVTGATAAALFLFVLIEYLDSLPVTSGDLLFLQTRQPYLVGAAIAHIFSGSMDRAALALGFAALLLIALWIFTASVGRFATVRALVEYFRARAAGIVPGNDAKNDPASNAAGNVPTNIRVLLRLNFLRAAVVLAAVLGLVGGAIVTGLGSADMHAKQEMRILLFIPLMGLICLIAWVLNWFLSLAAMMAASTGETAIGAMVAASELCCERAVAVFAVSIWTGLAHLIAFGAASMLAMMTLTFARAMPWRLVVLASLLVGLAYFAFADWLHVARLAGYVSITEMAELPASLSPIPFTPPPAPSIQTSIDRDELILSDLPNLEVQG
jgi:hypothetical protein